MERWFYFLDILQKMSDLMAKDKHFKKIPSQDYAHHMLFDCHNTHDFNNLLDLIKDREEFADLLEEFAQTTRELDRNYFALYKEEYQAYREQYPSSQYIEPIFEGDFIPTLEDNGEKDYNKPKTVYDSMQDCYVAS